MAEREIGVVNLDKPNLNEEELKKATPEKEEKKKGFDPHDHTKAGKAFSMVSFVLGIAGIPLAFVTFGIWLFINIPALIFGCVGKKIPTSKSKFAKIGIKLNIIGIVIDVIMCAVFFLLMILIIEGIVQM